MHRSLRPVVLTAVLATALVSCASAEQVDWQEVQEDADEFVATATAKSGSLGGATQRLSAQDPSAKEGGATLNFPSEMNIAGVVAACYGEGAARLDYSVSTGDAAAVDGSIDLQCNGGEKEIPLVERGDTVRLSAVLVSGTGAVVAASVSSGEE